MAKRGRPTNTNRVIKQLTNPSSVQKRTAIATDMFLPNHSGDHSAGIVNSTPTNDTDLVNKKYVDDKFPVTHASTTGQTTDDHHPQAHKAEHETGGGDLINHDSLTGFVANEHIDWTSDVSPTVIHANNYVDNDTTYAANQVLDWTTDQGATNIDAGNYINSTYTSSDFTHNDLTGLNDGTDYEHITQTQKDALHAESHDIASHSDTTATGTELDTLTDNSMADTLHRHSELSASDGTPDGHLSLNATGDLVFDSTFPKFYLKENDVSDNNYRIAVTAGDFKISEVDDSLAFVADRLVILDNGDVGIGGTPTTNLDVLGTNARIKLDTGGYDCKITFENQNDNFWTIGEIDDLAGYDSNSFVFSTSDNSLRTNAKMVINTDGNVGIGTNTPGAKFHLDGDAIIDTDSGTNPWYFSRLGVTNQAAKMWIDDSSFYIQSIQDEATANYGSIVEVLDSGAVSKWGVQVDSAINGALNANYKAWITSEGDGYFSGNVGIGTSSPTHKLNVVGDANITGNIRMEDNKIIDLGTDGALYYNSGFGTTILSSSTVAAVIDSSVGSFIISTTSPTIVFSVDNAGNTAASGTGTFTTMNTGQGATEIYDMNQDMRTDDAVTHTTITATTGFTASGSKVGIDSVNTYFFTNSVGSAVYRACVRDGIIYQISGASCA